MDIFKNYKLILIISFILIIVLWCYHNIEEPFDNTDTVTNIKKHTFDDYEILEIFNVLTPEECKTLIEITKNHGLEESEVLSYDNKKDTKIDNTYRKSKQAWLSDNYNPILMKLAKYSEKITGITMDNQEDTQVVVYQVGGQFKEHYDSCLHEADYCNKINRNAGERRATLIVYLNDNFTGGETEFVELNLKIKPETGKGVLFWSTNEKEELLPKSKHKAHILQSGEKWIATKWTHSKKFNK